MTSKEDKTRLNKPEKKYRKYKVVCSNNLASYQTEPYDIGRNEGIDEMDAYYKQFIKDNIPSVDKMAVAIRERQKEQDFSILGRIETYRIFRIAYLIHKLTKERLGV